jgi:hypothetical protein
MTKLLFKIKLYKRIDVQNWGQNRPELVHLRKLIDESLLNYFSI